jgi:hypothetical protein
MLQFVRRIGAVGTVTTLAVVARLAGLALAIASIPGFNDTLEVRTWPGHGAIGNGLGLLGIMLVLLGVLGVYAHRAGEFASILGLIIFLIAFLGVVLVVGFGAGWLQSLASEGLISSSDKDVELPPQLPLLFTLSFALVALVWALFGVAAAKSLVSLQTAAIALIFGAVPVLSPLLVPLPFTYLATGVYVVVLAFLIPVAPQQS